MFGQARYRNGDFQQAVEALEKSIEFDYNHKARSWFFLAMAHWKLGNKEEAHDYFEKAAEWMQNNEPAYAAFPTSQFRDEAATLLGLTRALSSERKTQAESESKTD